MKYGLIAVRLGHSFSREIHRAIGTFPYDFCELPPEELPEFMRRRDFEAINVTIPYKETVIPYLDHIDPLAASIGVVNTVVNRNGFLYGYNTDIGGMTALVQRLGLSLEGAKALTLGSGGTGRTAYAVAKSLGAAVVQPVSRREGSGCITYRQAVEQHSDAAFILNGTPIGMLPHVEDCPLDVSCFPELRGVTDAIYNPLSSRLVRSARQRGVPAQGGLYMLVVQAILAAEHFKGTPVPRELAEQIYRDLLCRHRNVVLIGMPGCGKSAVGREIARRMGRSFFDLDEEIRRMAGRTPEEIIRSDGEEAFRDLEAQAVRELEPKNGAVIACGGGTVLRPENVDRLRANGTLLYLYRPLESLTPSARHPLSDTPEKLRQRYEERESVYRAAADVVVEAGSDWEKNAEQAIRLFEEGCTE